MGPLVLYNRSLAGPSVQPTLLTKRCLRSRLNTNQCQRCLHSCQAGALNVIDQKISFDASQCTGCMSCVAACPQDALVSDYDMEKLPGSLGIDQDVVISCIHQKQSCNDEITVPCVGILSKELFTACVLRGCRSITFQLVDCSQCCNEKAAKAFRSSCRELLGELEELHPSTVIFNDKKERAIHHEMDRRSYMKKLRQLVVGISKNSFKFAPDHIAEAQGKSRRIPFKTKLIREIVTTLDRDSQKKVFHLFCHTISLTEDCTCCPLCKGICPTGAIKIECSAQVKYLNFEMLDCSGCGLCVEFCKNNAISLD